MVAERRFSSPENYAYLALLFSLLRPELQGYLKLGQDAVNPAITSLSNPYNLTGLAFSGTLPYDHGTNYGTNISINNFITSKEGVDAPGYYDPLSQFSDWQPNAEFNNSGIAMILGDTQVRSHLGSFDSGYSSSDEASSPLSTSSFNSHSTRQPLSPLGDISNLGAVGYTPPSGSNDYVHTLEDYVDLEYLANGEAKRNFDFIQDLPLALKHEPDYFLDKLLSPESSTDSIDIKTSPDGSYFPDDFNLGLETKEFDPFGIDFGQTITNSSLQYPLVGSDLDSVIDFDALDSLDFSLPPDILTTTENTYPTNNIQSQLQDLIQNPALVRNDPNGLKTVTTLDNAKMLTKIPATSTISNKKKFALVSTKAPAAAKKLTTTESKSMKSESFLAGISDDGIIDMPVTGFNTFLESLPEEKAKYVRDVRRRGKNKEAARVCRKRKFDAIDDLDDELKKIKLEKQKVLDEQRVILEETAALKFKISELETSLFNSLQDDNGQPLSISEYSLYQGTNGAVYIGKNFDNKKKKKQQKKST